MTRNRVSRIAVERKRVGGGICVADLHGHEIIDVRICETQFISNTAIRGGARLLGEAANEPIYALN